jgi:hypothetical protein
MLTEEVYPVLEEMDRHLNHVTYQMTQLRFLGNLFIGMESDDFSPGFFIVDYCVPALADIESLLECLCRLKELFPGR